MKKTTTPSTAPADVRGLLFDDPSRVTDAQLVALLLGKGSGRRRRGQPALTWTCLELGEAIYRDAGGELSGLVHALRRDAIDWRDFGIGEKLGARLIAAAELAHRWRRGLRRGGDASIRSDVDVQRAVFEHHKGVSEGELLTLLLERYGRGEDTVRLLECCTSPQALIDSLEFDSFTKTKVGSVSRMTIADTGLELTTAQLGWLFSGLELARRYRAQATLEQRQISAGASGLSALDLVTLLDTERRLDRPLRETLIGILRTHPEVARDFEDLDRLAAEAGVESHDEAVEAHRMFEELLRREGWSDPAEVVGPGVPFTRLLTIAEAKIGGGAGPPERLREVHELLLAAQREATAEPVASFVEVLLELGITDEGADAAFEEARRRYFERPAAGEAGG